MSKILGIRGLHYFATRFGWQKLRSAAFDEKYRSGEWNFQGKISDEVLATIRKNLRGGDLLILGCGDASVLASFQPTEFSSVFGLDLSGEAVRLASRFASERIVFEVGDMTTFQCPKAYDVILFSESLYYVPLTECEALLRRLSRYLKPGGVFVATFAQAKRYHAIIGMIRHGFDLFEDRKFSGSERHLLVFGE